MQKNLQLVILHRFFILYKKLMPYSTMFLVFFEPVVPFFVTLYLRRRLEALIQSETIKTYYLEIVRISKFRYSVKFKLVATSNQIVSIISNAIHDVMRRLQNG
jgi:hypothetical protein